MGSVRWGWVIVAVLAAVLVRLPASTTLTMDADEPIYLAASIEAGESFRDRNWSRLSNPRLNPEHPGLVKTLNGIVLTRSPDPQDLIMGLATVRGLSVMAGLGCGAGRRRTSAGGPGARDPHHPRQVQQSGLPRELPMLWMALAMLLGWRHRHDEEARAWWLVGGCWGAALAGKWLHGFPGLALLFFIPGWRVRARVVLTATAGWILLDPTMWSGPIDSVLQKIELHRAYAEGLTTQTTWMAPLLSLVSGGPARWHPEVFPVSLDPVWGGLAVVSLWRARREAFTRYLLAWMAVPLAVMMSGVPAGRSTPWSWSCRSVSHSASLGRGLRTLALSAQSERDVVPPHWRQPDQNFPSRSPRCPR